MNIEPRNLGIPLQRRSRFALWLGASVIAVLLVTYLLEPAFGKTMFSTVLLVLPALAVGGAIPLHRGQPLRFKSVGSTLLVALVIGYLVIAKRWLLPWLLSALG